MRSFNRKWGRFLIAFAATLIVTSTVAHAGITDNWFSGFLNQSSDNSAEYMIKRAGGGASTLEVTDILVTISDLGTNEDLNNGIGPDSYVIETGSEASVLAAIEVTSVIPLGGGLANLTFGPVSAAGRAAILAAAPLTGAEIGTWTPGTVAALYDDPTPDFSRLGSGPDDGDGIVGPPTDDMGAKANLPDDTGVGPFLTEDGISTLTFDGSASRILEIGFNGVAGEYWSATAAALDVNVLETVPVATAVGLINFGLNEIPGTNFTGHTFGLVANFDPVTLTAGMSNFNGSGSILGIGAQAPVQPAPSVILGPSTPFDAFDNIDIVFRPFKVQDTPEPSTIMLLGIGTVLLVGGCRRRRTRSA